MNRFVGFCSVNLVDEQIGVAFPMGIMYPTTTPGKIEKFGPYGLDVSIDASLKEGVYPLILISHGSGGSPLVHRTLAFHLASNGFIVALPEHPFNNKKDNTWEGTIKNLVNRPRHIRIAINWLFKSRKFATFLKQDAVAIIGHSMGGYTALAVAGGMPTSFQNELSDRVTQPINVTPDNRIKALVLFAPAAIWFRNKGALSEVKCPILMFVGEKDEYTGPNCPILMSEDIKGKFKPYGYHVHLILDGVPKNANVQLKLVKNAGHFSFLSPFPDSRRNTTFPPSQDPPGFNRENFHDELNSEVLDFLTNQLFI